MGKANMYYNSRDNRWEVRGKAGQVVFEIPDANSRVRQFVSFIGTNAAIAAVGSGAVAVGTITNATGLLPGDRIFGVPKADRSAGHVGFAGFFVPTNNVLNVHLQNSKSDSAGSYPATGWDILAIRMA